MLLKYLSLYYLLWIIYQNYFDYWIKTRQHKQKWLKFSLMKNHTISTNAYYLLLGCLAGLFIYDIHINNSYFFFLILQIDLKSWCWEAFFIFSSFQKKHASIYIFPEATFFIILLIFYFFWKKSTIILELFWFFFKIIWFLVSILPYSHDYFIFLARFIYFWT